ncbi:hypothetical protein NFI96_026010, partial [Prochilodus magdalenae]
SYRAVPVQEFPESSPGLRRRKREWLIPPISFPENDRGPHPKRIVQIKSSLGIESKITYSLTGEGADQPPVGLFTINKLDGTLFVTKPLDRETKDKYTTNVSYGCGALKTKWVEFITVTATDADDPDTDNADVRYSIISQNPPLPNPNMFIINPVTGVIRVNSEGLDREKHPEYTLEIQASDMQGNGLVSIGRAVINVTERNDHAPQFDKASYSVSVPENKAGAVVVKLPVTDADEPQTPAWTAKFRIVSGNSDGFFNVSTGPSKQEAVITTAKPLDFEQNSQYTLEVVAENDVVFGKLLTTSTTTVIGTVSDLSPYQDHKDLATEEDTQSLAGMNEHMNVVLEFPESSAGLRRRKREWVIPPVSFPENDKGPFPKRMVQIKSSYGKETKITYSITGEGADQPPVGLFTINKLDGTLFVTKPVDRETKDKYTGTIIYVQASFISLVFGMCVTLKSLQAHAVSPEVKEDPMEIVVNVIDMNDNKPVFTQYPFNGSVPEASPIGFEFMTVTATDADDPETDNADVRYTINSQTPQTPNTNMFVINPVTGAIRVNSEGLDREKYPEYTLEIQASDMQGNGLVSIGRAVITVTDSNDHAPIFEKISYSVSVPENEVGAVVVKMPVTDGDEPQSPAWTTRFRIVSGNRDGFFSVSTGPNKQEGIITTVKPLDLKENNKYTLLVVAENDVPFAKPLTTSTATVIVNVVVGNKAPVFHPEELIISVAENLAADDKLTVYTATDPDTAKTQKVTYRVGADPAGWLSVDTETGLVKVRSPMDRESPFVKEGRYTALILAMDDDQVPATGTGTLVIEVKDVNDNPPTINEKMIRVCNKQSAPVLLSVTDRDGSGFAAPYQVELQGESRNIWSAMMNAKKTGIILQLQTTLKEGVYVIVLRVYDNMDRYQDSVVLASVCDCTEAEVCGNPYLNNLEYFCRKVLGTVSDLSPFQDHKDLDTQSLAACGVNVRDGGERDTNDLLSHAHYSLQGLAIDCGAVPKPGSDAAAQDALDGSSVEGGEDGRWEMCLPQPAQEVETLLGFLGYGAGVEGPGEILCQVNSKELGALDSLHNGAVDIKSVYAKETKITYSITGEGADQPPVGLFTINKRDGTLFVTKALDRETKDKYTLQAHAVSPEVKEEPMEIVVNVIDMNDNKPVFIQDPFIGSVSGASPIGFEFMTVTATDADDPETDNADVRYTIVSQTPQTPNPNMFIINPVTGAIRVNSEGLDREKDSEYTLEIQSADMQGNGLVSMGKAVITVTDSNDHAPRFEKDLYSVTVPENKVGFVVVKMPVTDGDDPQSPAWTARFRIVSGNNGGFFNVSTGPNKQEGIVTTVKPLDYEENNKYTLLVVAENNVPFAKPLNTSTATVIVNVIDVNEAPVFNPEELIISVPENLAVDDKLTVYTATDPDTAKNQKVIYRVGNDPAGWLNVEEETGQIKVRSSMDRESPIVKDDKYTALILAVDDDQVPATGTGTLVIKLTDVNDNAPTINEKMIRVCNRQSAPVLLSVTDRDGPSFTAPYQVKLQAESRNIWSAMMNETKTGIILQLQTALKEGVYVIVLRVYDNMDRYQDSTILASPKYYPQIAIKFCRRAAVRKQWYQKKSFRVETFRASNSFLINSLIIRASAYRVYDDPYSLAGFAPELHQTIQTVHEFPESSLVLRRRKREWVIPPISFPENDRGPFPKRMVQIKSSYGKETKITYSITGEGADQPPAGLFTINKLDGTLFVTKPLDRETKDKYTLQAHAVSPEVKEDPMEIIVNVIDMNDNKPVFTQDPFTGSVPEASPIGRFEFMTVTATDADDPETDNADVRYTIVSQTPQTPNPNMFVINPVTGAIRVNSEGLDREKDSEYTLEIQAADMQGNGLVSMGKANITVTDSNDHAPTFEKTSYSVTVPENKVGFVVVKMPVTDGDEPQSPAWAARFRIVSGNRDGFFNVSTGPNKQEGIVTTVKPLDYEENNKYTLLVVAENNVPFAKPLTTSTATVIVNVGDVNEAPVFHPEEEIISVPENLAVDDKLTVYTATDPDTAKNQKVIYRVGNDSAGWLNVEEETGQIKVRSSMDRESLIVKDDKYTALILAIDDDQIPATGTGTLVIKLTDVNDNAPVIEERSIKVCNKESVPVLLSVTDKDGPNFGAPYKVELQGDSERNWSAVMNETKTGIKLQLQTTLEYGVYSVVMRVYDNGDKFQDSTISATNLQAADNDPTAPPYDSLLVFHYEAGSLSSLNSTSSGDQDYDCVSEWGPHFKKLADMYRVGADPAGWLSVDAETGLVKVRSPMDRESPFVKEGRYTALILAVDD